MLLTGIKDDSDRAFILSLYQDYYGLVRKKIFDITRDQESLEDLINDTFIKLIEKISVIRTLECCKTAAYVVYTARSVAINFIKHRDVEHKYLYYGAGEDLAGKIPDYEAVEESIIREERIEELGRAMAKLPEREKDLLHFKYILEMNDEQLGQILGIATASVRQYLTRSRRKAKELIDKGVNQDGK
ncbi:Sigma-70 region 2 [Desulfitobacterium hafniense DP7]|uniref:Sigma-70 region 2 n=2 Tax=Desulfitobacterium hafniense TaxID=49338 RepID=G9XLN5_DESHA|nr:Sigma-70 region 2 [Desulfitobacterium hafniense DP7]